MHINWRCFKFQNPESFTSRSNQTINLDVPTNLTRCPSRPQHTGPKKVRECLEPVLSLLFYAFHEFLSFSSLSPSDLHTLAHNPLKTPNDLQDSLVSRVRSCLFIILSLLTNLKPHSLFHFARFVGFGLLAGFALSLSPLDGHIFPLSRLFFFLWSTWRWCSRLWLDDEPALGASSVWQFAFRRNVLRRFWEFGAVSGCES